MFRFLKSVFLKSFAPFLLVGISFAIIYYPFFQNQVSYYLKYFFSIFLHYGLFISVGILVHLMISKFQLLEKILLEIFFGFLLLLIILISFGSYFSLKNWHSPISFYAMSDFLHNHEHYVEKILPLNYYINLFILLLGVLGIFTLLHRLYPFHLKIINWFSQKILIVLSNNWKYIILGISLTFILFLNLVDIPLKKISTQYIEKEPLTYFYNSATIRYQLISEVRQKEKLFSTLLKEKYPNPVSPTKNVILITLDALRKDYLPCYGFSEKTTPYLDSFLLNHNHTIVQQPIAVCNYSIGGIPSILESSLSNEIGIKKLGIQNYLAHWGYHNNFILGGNHKAFENLDLLYGEKLNYYFEGYRAEKYIPSDDRLIPLALQKYFETTKWRKESNFFWFHLMSTHVAGPIDFAFRKFNPSEVTVHSSEYSVELEEKYINNYKNGILQGDAIIHQILTQIEEKGILENATIIITSDHGESLGENKLLMHANTLNYPELNIPFIIIDKDIKDSTTLQFGSHLDIGPTIIDLLDLPQPEMWEGNSVFSQNQKVVPIASAKKDEFGVAMPFENTWLALVKKGNNERFIFLDKASIDISLKKIPLNIKNKLRKEWNSNFIDKFSLN